MKSGFELIEARLQSLFEGLDFLSTSDKKVALVKKITVAMNAVKNTMPPAESQTYRIMIQMAPKDYQTWMADSDWIAPLAREIQSAAEDTMSTPISRPQIQVSPNSSLIVGDMEVDAFLVDMESESGGTSAMEVDRPSKDVAIDTLPKDAYLILNGMEQIPLTIPVVNIGRRRENQIILADPRVSRNHAQLRASYGHFEIFDLDSSGGIFINGVRVTHQRLKSGDAISLAGVLLIYIEEGFTAQMDTDKLPPRPPVEPTEK